jgi:hypothetical protein
MKKRLIVSIIVALLVFSMPFVATLQAGSADPVATSGKSTMVQSSGALDSAAVSLKEVVAGTQVITYTLLQEYGNIPEVQTLCQEANAILNGINNGNLIDCDNIYDLMLGLTALYWILFILPGLKGLEDLVLNLHQGINFIYALFCPDHVPVSVSIR